MNWSSSRNYRDGSRGYSTTGRGGGTGRRVFDKLLKDENASVRSFNDACRFLDGMESFDAASKPNLLMKLDDNRGQGPRRIAEILSYMDSIPRVQDLLLRLLFHVMTSETGRPLYRPLRNKVLILIFSVPMLVKTLVDLEAVSNLPQEGAQSLCRFFEAVSCSFMEARTNRFVIDIAKQLRDRNGVDSHALCSIVFVEEEDDSNAGLIATSQNPKNPVVWVTDERRPGGRHDNDYLNFRNIRILPTANELRCEVRPWLPLSTGANNFVRDPISRVIGNNFRLLREDTVFAMKEKILAGFRPWKNARIVDLDVSVPKGLVAFMVQCDPKHKKVDWEFSRWLSHGTVLAFCTDDTPVLMGTIESRDPKKLNSPGGPKIGVTFDTHGDHFKDALHILVHNYSLLGNSSQENEEDEEPHSKYRGEMSCFDMIEASSSFATYQHILKSLQQITALPFVDEICNGTCLAAPAPLDYLQDRLLMPDDDICRSHILDLTAAMTDELVSKTKLDHSQARAIEHVFMNRVSLIQGPPGCGKTFIGGLIAQMIRMNTDESILCLCYTNHALDQFLEHMLDAGEKKLVRIGSRSRSERVAGYNLRELSRRKSIRHDNRRFKQVVAQMHGARERIEASIADIKQPIKWKTPHGGVEQYLEYEKPKFYQCLCLPKFADGFKMVGSNNKELSSDYLWKRWFAGDNFPDFLRGYAMTDDLPPEFEDFWTIPLAERAIMANEWKLEIVDNDVNELVRSVEEFQVLCDERRSIKQQQDLEILQDARVIGATTTGAAQYKDLLASKKPGVLIVEEAGEVLEAHVLSALQAEATKHLILIGDHKQLRPKVETYELTTVSECGYSIDRSLFERLVLAKLPSVTLEVQHRMRPTISEFIRMQTYPDLVDHGSVKNYQNVRGVKDNVVFIDHRHHEDFEDDGDNGVPSTSKSNDYEVGMCISVAKFFLHQGYRPDRIAILTPYLGQLQQIVRRVHNDLKEATAFLSERDYRDLEDLEEIARESEQREFEVKSLRCSSIDNFQGEEADIVIISLVRSNKKGQIGFLKEAQRVNVLMSRARLGMFLIGNSQTLRISPQGKQIWDPIVDLFDRNSCLLKGLPTFCERHPDDDPAILSTVDDFRRIRPNGGCWRICGERLECGHQCKLACHPFDREHKSLGIQCVEPCRRVPSKCNDGHRCPKLCKDPCGPCRFPKGRFQLLKCEHWVDSVYCHDIRDEAAVRELSQNCVVQVKCSFEPCGHQETTACANAQLEQPQCPAKCGKTVEACGHPCSQPCRECIGTHKCDQICQRKLFCGHFCGRRCHLGECPPCKEPCIVSCVHSSCPKVCRKMCSSCIETCDWQCDHEGKCQLVCGAPCGRLPCSKRCTKKMACGHQCPSICGESCPGVEYCRECCSKDKQGAIVDHILMSEYKDHDLDEDPILILPCGHFFSSSTLDGHFGMDEVYERKAIDTLEYSALKPLGSAEINEKPRTCPQCRAVAHSLNRYGRIFRLSELRALERKHLMDVNNHLQHFLKLVEKGDSACKDLIDRLEHLEGRILKGPMQKVYDACFEVRDSVEVPIPPQSQLIQVIELIGRVCATASEAFDDKYDKKAKDAYCRAMALADASTSIRAGARIRLRLVGVLTKWPLPTKEEKKEGIDYLNWIISQSHAVPELAKEANEVKKSLLDPMREISQVMRAVSIKETGNDYETSWTSHWYQCRNGHPYYIGECGGAMQESTCPECGLPVGGSGHRLHSTNTSVGGIYATAINSATR